MKDFAGGGNRETKVNLEFVLGKKKKKKFVLGTSFPKNVSVGPPPWALLFSLVSILLDFSLSRSFCIHKVPVHILAISMTIEANK